MNGQKLKKLRRDKGWTQAKLAQYLNVDPSAIGKWEIYNVTPAIDTLKRICSLFDVPISYLLDIESNSKDSKENIITIFGFGGERKDFELNSEQIKLIEQLAEHMQKENDK